MNHSLNLYWMRPECKRLKGKEMDPPEGTAARQVRLAERDRKGRKRREKRWVNGVLGMAIMVAGTGASGGAKGLVRPSWASRNPHLRQGSGGGPGSGPFPRRAPKRDSPPREGFGVDAGRLRLGKPARRRPTATPPSRKRSSTP